MAAPKRKRKGSTSSTPPEGWKFKRSHLKGVSCKINANCKENNMITIYNVLSKRGEDCLAMFKRSCFGKFLAFSKKIGRSLALIHEVMAHQVVECRNDKYSTSELHFFIGGKMLRFGRVEFALTTGLLFGEATIDLDDDSSESSANSLHMRKFENADVTVKKLFACFKTKKWSDLDADYVKAAKILVVYTLLLGVVRSKKIEGWIWKLVELEAEWESFPWGSYSFQNLIYYLNAIKVSEVAFEKNPSYHLNGFVTAFLGWIFCAMPEIAEQSGIIDSKIIPRMFRYQYKFFKETDLRIVEKVVQEFEPSEEEEDTNYWQSITTEPDDDLLMNLERFKVFINPDSDIETNEEDDDVEAETDGENELAMTVKERGATVRKQKKKKKEVGGVVIDEEKLQTYIEAVIATTLQNLDKHVPMYAEFIEYKRRREARVAEDGQIDEQVLEVGDGKEDSIRLDALNDNVATPTVTVQVDDPNEDSVRVAALNDDVGSPDPQDQIKSGIGANESTRTDVVVAEIPVGVGMETPEHVRMCDYVDDTSPNTWAKIDNEVSIITQRFHNPMAAQFALLTQTESEMDSVITDQHGGNVVEKTNAVEGDSSDNLGGEEASKDIDTKLRYVRMRRRGPCLKSPFLSGESRGMNYGKFMESTNETRNVGLNHVVGPDWFADIENHEIELSREHMDCYLCCLESFPEHAGIQRDNNRITITSLSFVEMVNEVWLKNHPTEDEMEMNPFIEEVVETKDLVKLAEFALGAKPTWKGIRSWFNIDSVVTVMKGLDGWLTCELNLTTKEIFLYDPLATNKKLTALNFQSDKLSPLPRILPLVLDYINFYNSREGIDQSSKKLQCKISYFPKKIMRVPATKITTGAFCLRMASALVTRSTPTSFTKADMIDFRKQVALSIYKYSTDGSTQPVV